MAPVSDQPGSDLPGALEAIRAGVIASNPQLYRHLALYLQVLRETLPHRLEQACFHLATRLHAGTYVAMPGPDRHRLHRRLVELVRHCCSLLTVEQLACLAAQMAREEGRRRRLAQRRLLERLTTVGAEPLEGSSGPGEPPEPSSLPEGALSIPVSFRLRLAEGRRSPAAGSEFRDALPPDGEPAPGNDDDDLAVDDPQGHGTATDESPQEHGFDPGDPSPWEQGRLPGDPVELLCWLDGIDHALQRRLRNLSHAVNVELLRAGLCSTLLPVSLLDAALHGRVDSAPAPPHLLVLPLPFAVPGLPAGLPSMAVLLRRADLELEEPRLRTCRRRLQQHRQELRRMANRFRRLQRRLDIHQAERLWLQDHPPPAPQEN